MEPGAGTFARVLRSLINRNVIHPDDSVLVQFAGSYDEEVCASIGLRNCRFANIAPGSPSTGQLIARQADAHRMPQADKSFDHVVAHSGLHHCSRPHEALHEMYRIATKSVVFVENQDSHLMRAAGRLGVVGWFELAAVTGGNYVSGGVDGSGVPNYVYRWTRREVQKAVTAFDPAYEIPIEFLVEWNLGSARTSSTVLRRKLHLRSDVLTEQLLAKGQTAMNRILPGQGNIFAATVRKDLAVLRPWMRSPTSLRCE